MLTQATVMPLLFDAVPTSQVVEWSKQVNRTRGAMSHSVLCPFIRAVMDSFLELKTFFFFAFCSRRFENRLNENERKNDKDKMNTKVLQERDLQASRFLTFRSEISRFPSHSSRVY
jgi:hypothetical protein